MDINLGQLIIQSFLDSIGPTSYAAWQMLLDNPWMFLLLPGMLLLGYVNRRMGRRNRRSY